ncbi:hypothetical protein FSP39_006903 [Pinctada imbricata]|uniref:Endonuclease/exonuclease/phosphatase domain-containing protein n=1 Tax=Pinctada imbricata TaxID=66713 RepID=A0AA88Y9I3_PINIB|nr:hypothetical protein FSP39_006903 [Pinctada imbricata]
MELPQECITCLVTSGFDRVFSDCIGSNSGGINVPGLVLLSRLPLRNVKKVDLIPGIKQLLPRSYLYAEVDGIGSVACTHLTAYLSNTYFEPSLRTTFRSWAEQNLYEVSSLVSGLRHLPRVIVMGDLNSGPSVPERRVIPAIPESFFTFTKNKFTAPYVDRIGQCTYCRENPIAGTNLNFILDHILLKGYEARMVRRIFDHLIPGQDYPSSDHYGVEVTLPESFENRPCHYILNLYSLKRFLPHGVCA